MSSIFEKIYYSLPVSLQNLAVSVQGWKYNRRRYSKIYHSYVDKLMRSQWWSCEDFRSMQVLELRKLIAEAIDNVPYYSKTLGHIKNSIEDLTLDSLKKLPFVEKTMLRENTDAFINRRRLRFGYDEGHTSGTSGSALVWPYDALSIQHDLAFRQRQYRWAGITGEEASARFSGRIILGKHNKSPFWRYNFAENQWLFSTYHINEHNLPLYYDTFKALNLVYLDGYPSALFSVARWINEQGKSGLWRPWAVITTAETLTDFQRREIEKAFNCRVFNFYSSSEGAPFITQCSAGSMHLNPESGIIEFLRPDGTEAQLGEEAEMVVTSFFQRTMPIIRYRIGDMGALAVDQTCSCGRFMPIIEYISGRESDILYTTQRGRISSAGMSTAFYKLPSRIIESQLQQIDLNSFIFRYVPLGPTLTEEEKSLVLKQFKDRLGTSIQIDIQQVTEIYKGKTGKTRLIVGLDRLKEGPG